MRVAKAFVSYVCQDRAVLMVQRTLHMLYNNGNNNTQNVSTFPLRFCVCELWSVFCWTWCNIIINLVFIQEAPMQMKMKKSRLTRNKMLFMRMVTAQSHLLLVKSLNMNQCPQYYISVTFQMANVFYQDCLLLWCQIFRCYPQIHVLNVSFFIICHKCYQIKYSNEYCMVHHYLYKNDLSVIAIVLSCEKDV